MSIVSSETGVGSAGPVPRRSRALTLPVVAGRSVISLLYYGIRLWAAVCLALFIAFYLELDNAFWAGTTAAITCQPVLGASLRKGWFRMLGTFVGAAAIVVITACFPQSRAGFMIALATWGAICGFVATVLRNFAAYAAALAGYTASIIAGDTLGATGGASDEVFNLAIARASEICIGIVCAGVVLASTDLGRARRHLSTLLATLSAEIITGLISALHLPPSAQAQSRPIRREFIRRVSGLDTVIDQALGEAPALRSHPRSLQAAADGLFSALSAWRTVATHLERTPASDSERGTILRLLPDELSFEPNEADRPACSWVTEPSRIRQVCMASARTLIALSVPTSSLRLLADRTAEGLLAIGRALTGVIIVNDPHRPGIRSGSKRLRVPDMLPALLNAIRVFVTIGAVELVWVWTAWPNGAVALIFAAVTVIIFSPRQDTASAATQSFLFGTMIAAGLAAVIAFVVLPQQTTFVGLCLAIGLVLVPAGALSAQAWQTPVFMAMASNFIPLLAPANRMSYDPQQFYNTALALLAGVAMALLGMRLIPPLPSGLRARRLLSLTLRDLRRLATGSGPRSIADWEGHVYGRLSAMPEQADPLQHARLVTALSVGTEIIRLRRIAGRVIVRVDLDAGLAAITAGNSAAAIESLRRFDNMLAALGPAEPDWEIRLRMRGVISVITEALAQHASYFDAKVPS
jgi:uncharacterized membrane protein YccC